MDAMKKAQVEKYVVAALLVVFVAVFVKGPLASLGLFRSKTPAATATAPTSVTVTVPATTAAARLAGQASVQPAEPQVVMGEPSASEEKKAVYTAHDLRDPFESLLPASPRSRPFMADTGSIVGIESGGGVLATSPPAASSLHVTGMLWGGAAPKAIINGTVYQVNDVVEGITIVAIDRRGVAIDHNGTRVYLRPSSASQGIMSARSQDVRRR